MAEVKVTLPLDKKWTVREVSSDDPKLTYRGKQSWGMTYFKTKEIYIDEEMSPDRKIEVIRHELTHAVIFDTQFAETKKYTQEDLCDLMGIYGKIICEIADKIMKKLSEGK